MKKIVILFVCFAFVPIQSFAWDIILKKKLKKADAHVLSKEDQTILRKKIGVFFKKWKDFGKNDRSKDKKIEKQTNELLSYFVSPKTALYNNLGYAENARFLPADHYFDKLNKDFPKGIHLHFGFWKMDKRIDSKGLLKVYVRSSQMGMNQENKRILSKDSLVFMLKVSLENGKLKDFRIDSMQKFQSKKDTVFYYEDSATHLKTHLQHALDRLEFYGKAYGIILDNNNSGEVAHYWQANLLRSLQEENVLMEVGLMNKNGSIDYQTKNLKNYIHDLRKIGYKNVRSYITPLPRLEGKYLTILKEIGRYSDESLANLAQLATFSKAQDGSWRRKVWYAQFFEAQHRNDQHRRQNVWVLKELELILKETPLPDSPIRKSEKTYQIFWGNTKVVALMSLDEFWKWH